VAEGAGTNSLYENERGPDTRRVEIRTMTADGYCRARGIETVHFMKCDTEGHDLFVLLGATELFRQERILVCQFEYNSRWVYSRSYLKDVFDFLKGTAYRLGKITPGCVELYKHWHPELERFFEGNYLIVHSRAIDWFCVVDGTMDDFNTYRAPSTAA
jgi:hypothetical protein